MQYTLTNGIEIKDISGTHKEILEYDFLKQSDYNKIVFIAQNLRLTYNQDISLKFNKIKDFMINNNLINKDNIFIDKFIIKLLAKLIYEYNYLLK